MFGRVLLVGSLSSTDRARKEYLTAPGHSEGQGIADFAAVTLVTLMSQRRTESGA